MQTDFMRREGGVAVTDAGGQLKCKKIFHVVAVPEEKSWQRVVKNILEKAEALQLQSIAIPALGTGIYTEPVSFPS
jgi:O-acetyl-ADP-ribose deacetylase (regulator of RNase III)